MKYLGQGQGDFGLYEEHREIRVSSYDGKSKSTPRLVQTIDDARKGDGLLIVDDVVDSGDTALLVRQLFPSAYLVSVYGKREGLRRIAASGETHVCVESFPQELWIVFPWDQESWDGEVPRSVAAYRQRTDTETAGTG